MGYKDTKIKWYGGTAFTSSSEGFPFKCTLFPSNLMQNKLL